MDPTVIFLTLTPFLHGNKLLWNLKVAQQNPNDKSHNCKVGYQDNHIWKNTSVHKDSHGCKKWEIMKCANGDTMTMKITIKLCGVMVLLSY